MELPLDCEAWYYSEFLTPTESKGLFREIAASCDLSDAVINMADGTQVQLNHGGFVFADAPLVETTAGDVFTFDVDVFRKKCLLEGLDDISLTLQHVEEIKTFEANKRVEEPWLFGQ